MSAMEGHGKACSNKYWNNVAICFLHGAVSLSKKSCSANGCMSISQRNGLCHHHNTAAAAAAAATTTTTTEEPTKSYLLD